MVISHFLYVHSFITAHKAHRNLAFPSLTWILFPLDSLYPGHTASHAFSWPFSWLSLFSTCALAQVIFSAWNVLCFLFYLETSHAVQNTPLTPFRFFFFIAFCYLLLWCLIHSVLNMYIFIHLPSCICLPH